MAVWFVFVCACRRGRGPHDFYTYFTPLIISEFSVAKALGEIALCNEAFHKDRAVWYEHVTGDSLDGLSLAEQMERVDVIARRFRVYNDGRAPRPREHMPPDTRDS